MRITTQLCLSTFFIFVLDPRPPKLALRSARTTARRHIIRFLLGGGDTSHVVVEVGVLSVHGLWPFWTPDLGPALLKNSFNSYLGPTLPRGGPGGGFGVDSGTDPGENWL